jgi:hypothetical protein
MCGPAKAQIAETVAVSVLLDQLFKGIDDTINKARDTGDYLLMRAGVQAKDALLNWKQVNSDLMDKAFSDLKGAQRDIFLNANAFVDNANADVKARIADAQKTVDAGDQLVNSLPTAGYTYVSRYGPQVILPPEKGEDDNLVISVTGVNLADASPVLTLNGKGAKLISQTQIEARFELPTSALQAEQAKMTTNSGEISYKTKSRSWIKWIFGFRDEQRKPIAVVVLPVTLGSIKGTYAVARTSREEKEFTRALGQFKGSNETVAKIATPEEGWLWDVTKPLKSIQGQGESAHCDGVDLNQSSANGLRYTARADRIGRSFTYPNGAPGYVDCSVKGTLYRMVPAEDPFTIDAQDVGWTDITIPLKENAKSISVTVSTFDKRSRDFAGSGADKLFSITTTDKGLIIHPRLPEDL